MATNIAMAVIEESENSTYDQIQRDDGTTALTRSAVRKQNPYVEVEGQNIRQTIAPEFESEGDYARLQRDRGQSAEEHPLGGSSTDRELTASRKTDNQGEQLATSSPCQALGPWHGSVVLCLLLASTLFSLGAVILAGVAFQESTSHSHQAPVSALPGVAVGNITQWSDMYKHWRGEVFLKKQQ